MSASSGASESAFAAARAGRNASRVVGLARIGYRVRCRASARREQCRSRFVASCGHFFACSRVVAGQKLPADGTRSRKSPANRDTPSRCLMSRSTRC